MQVLFYVQWAPRNTKAPNRTWQNQHRHSVPLQILHPTKNQHKQTDPQRGSWNCCVPIAAPWAPFTSLFSIKAPNFELITSSCEW